IQNVAVLAESAVDEQTQLFEEIVADVAVQVREDRRIGLNLRQLRHVQPLEGEVGGQRLGAGIGQHPMDLGLQNLRLVQLTLLGYAQQLLIRQAAPQEER